MKYHCKLHIIPDWIWVMRLWASDLFLHWIPAVSYKCTVLGPKVSGTSVLIRWNCKGSLLNITPWLNIPVTMKTYCPSRKILILIFPSANISVFKSINLDIPPQEKSISPYYIRGNRWLNQRVGIGTPKKVFTSFPSKWGWIDTWPLLQDECGHVC